MEERIILKEKKQFPLKPSLIKKEICWKKRSVVEVISANMR